MTARASKNGEGTCSFLVQAQSLSDYKPQTAAGPISGFEILLEGEALNAGACAPRDAPRWLEEVKGAIKAAEEAGLRSYRIEIAPDGTIALVVCTQSETGVDTGADRKVTYSDSSAHRPPRA